MCVCACLYRHYYFFIACDKQWYLGAGFPYSALSLSNGCFVSVIDAPSLVINCCESCAAEYATCCSRGCQDQRSRQDLRVSVMRTERAAILSASSTAHATMTAAPRYSMHAMEGEHSDPGGGISRSGEIEGEEGEEMATRDLMWLLWPFQVCVS